MNRGVKHVLMRIFEVRALSRYASHIKHGSREHHRSKSISRGNRSIEMLAGMISLGAVRRT